MEIWSSKDKDVTTIYVRGDVDEHTAGDIRSYADSIINNGTKSLVFCLKYVDFMDSTGIGMLLGRFKNCKKTHTALYVKDVNPSVDKIFKISGVYSVIPLVR